MADSATSNLPPCDCSWIDSKLYCAFDADPDIAGIGIIVSFVVSVYLTFAILLYTFFVVPEAFPTGKVNRLDYIVIKRFRQACRFIASPLIRRGLRVPDWSINHKDLKAIILMLNDQQLVTGFSIMTVAYVQIRTITTYHFYIVSALAEASFAAHWGTVNLLRDELLQHPVKKQWRICALLAFVAIVLVTQIPIGHSYWNYTYGVSTACIWSDMSGNYHGSQLLWMSTNMLLICLSAVQITYEFHNWQVFDQTIEWIVTRAVRVSLLPQVLYLYSSGRATQSGSTSSKLSWIVLRKVCYGIAIFVFGVTELILSQSLDLLRTWGILLNNVSLAFQLRNTGTENGMTGSENRWSFGQAVPVFLLFLPLASIAETLFENILASGSGTGTTDSDSGHDMILDDESRHTEEPISVDTTANASVPARSSARSPPHSVNRPISRSLRSIHIVELDEESRGSIAMRNDDLADRPRNAGSFIRPNNEGRLTNTTNSRYVRTHDIMKAETVLEAGVYKLAHVEWVVVITVVGLFALLTYAGWTGVPWLV